jgi:hypothetical protein
MSRYRRLLTSSKRPRPRSGPLGQVPPPLEAATHASHIQGLTRLPSRAASRTPTGTRSSGTVVTPEADDLPNTGDPYGTLYRNPLGHVKVGHVDQADLEEARRLMQLEYETAQGSIASFDGHRFRIKEWAVTVAGALLALAVDSHSWSLGVIATTTVLFFAYIEIISMEIQHRVINQSNHLEKCMEAARRGDVPIHTPSELEVFL